MDLTDEQMRDLGLTDSVLEQSEVLQWPREAAAHGLVRPLETQDPSLDSAAAGEGGALFARVGTDLGVTIERMMTRPVLRVTSPGTDRVLLSSGTVRGGVDRQAPHHRIAFELPEDRTPVAVRLGDAKVLVFRLAHDALEIASFRAAGVHGHRSLELFPAITSWLEGSRDRWLTERVNAWVEAGDPWLLVVGAASAIRLGEASLDAATRWLREPAAPPPGSEWLPALQWIANLTSRDRLLVADLAQVEVDRLQSRLADLLESFAPSTSEWQFALFQTCCLREDLAAFQGLFGNVTEASDVNSGLAAIDAEARRFMRSVPVLERIDDERLRRVARGDPEAWWTWLSDESVSRGR